MLIKTFSEVNLICYLPYSHEVYWLEVRADNSETKDLTSISINALSFKFSLNLSFKNRLLSFKHILCESGIFFGEKLWNY